MRLIDADSLIERFSVIFDVVGVENFIVCALGTPEIQVNVEAVIKGEPTVMVDNDGKLETP